MNLRAYQFLDIVWQTLSVVGSIWVSINVWQIGVMFFFIALGIAQTTSLLVHIMSKEIQVKKVRKWLHRGMYVAFGLLMLQIIIMQLSAAFGYFSLIVFGVYTGLLMGAYYINTWVELFSRNRN